MWLYVPNISTSSPSAQVDSASISASSWQFQALEQSAWSRGKPSRSRNWYQQWKRAIWLQRLFGAMPEPSMAEHGVAQLTASLVASRASHIAQLESSSEKRTNATSGLTRAVSSSSPGLGLRSLKTSGASYQQEVRNASGETFKDWALRLREDCSRRQKLAQVMEGNGSSSSRWLTPRASESGEDSETFVARMGDRGANCFSSISAQAMKWPTPVVADSVGARNRTSGRSNPNSRHHDGVTLNDAIALWQTPAVADTTGGRMSRSGERSRELLLKGQAYHFSLPGHQTPQHGQNASEPRRTLNPRFVEWLMGWPPRWTNSECSAMELCHFKQRMRSALLSLGLPQEAPPAQLALFG